MTAWGLFFQAMKVSSKSGALVIIFLSFFAVKALLQPGFFTTHDGDWMVIRLSAFHQSLREGHFPVRWTQRLNDNYGYPVLNFLYPLPFYLAEPFVLAGVGFVNAVKMVFLLSLLGSALAMFAWLSRYGTAPALVAALLYLYTPYRFVDVYVRGSLGEAVGFIFPPLVFWGVDRLRKERSFKRAAFLALAAAGLILSHNVFALIFGVLAGAYVVFQFVLNRDRSFLAWSLFGLGWGALLSAFFWLPALSETGYTRFPQTTVADFRDHFPTLGQLVYSKWGWGYSVPGAEDQMAFQVGVANYLALAAAGVVFLRSRSRRLLFFLAGFGTGFFFMLRSSAPVWDLTRLGVIQFPWRFLALTTFTSAAAGGMALAGRSRRVAAATGGLIVVLALYGNRHHLQANLPTFKPDSYYATNEATTTVSDEYLPKWAVDPLPGRAGRLVEIAGGEGRLDLDRGRTGAIAWRSESAEGLKLRINALFYPGWIYRIDGRPAAPEIDSTGRPVVTIPPGRHRGEAVFTETPFRLAADLISLAALAALLLAFFRKRIFGWTLAAVVLLALGTVAPLRRPGWFPIHDDTQVARIYEMTEALRQGQFPVRWVGDLGYGYGYPLFNYYAPLPYYVGAAFVLLGFNALAAAKLVVAAAMILGGVGVFLLLRKPFGSWSALLGAGLYLYIPFRAVELYVRGAVAELWGMAWLPLALAGVEFLVGPERLSLLGFGFAALAAAALILSHNLTALIGLPVVFLYGLVRISAKKKKKKRLKRLILSLALALGLAAFYWLPAWVERGSIDAARLVAGGGGDFRRHFLFLDQLWDSPWGFGGSIAGRPDGMSFKIGKLHLLLAGAGLFLAALKRKTARERRVWLFAGLFGGAVFMTLAPSRPIWELFSPLLAFLQYPWRFLVLVSLFVSLLGGLLPWGLASLWSGWKRGPFLGIFTVFLVGAVVGVNAKYFRPQRQRQVSAGEMVKRQRLRWEVSKRSDEFLPPGFAVPRSEEETAVSPVEAAEGVEITWRERRFHAKSVKVRSAKEATVFLNVVAFPGWRLFLDGSPRKALADPSGRQRLGLTIPPGQHLVEARFENTPIRSLADAFSLGSVVVWLVYSFLTYRSCSSPAPRSRRPPAV
jgi:hypothetical protein